jgi:small-conductance mechanosensitive channel/CRP-like cAMP-binding protein
VPASLSSLPVYLRGLEFSIWAELIFLSVGLYLVLVAVGRLLKYRLGTRLGQIYQLFCVAAGPYVAITALRPSLPGQRDLGALTVMLGAGVLVRLLDQYFWRGYLETRRKAGVPKFIREIAGVIVMLGALLLVLKFAYHRDFPVGLLAASGVVSIILGFALQDSLGNIIGGFAIQVGRPFQVGDWLLVDSQAVQAVEINWRSTRFVTNDDVQLDVPNQQIVRSTIVNYHGGGSRHGMRLEVGVQYDAPPNRVREILVHAAAAANGVLKDPAPNVFLKNFGESAIIYELRFWIDDHRRLNVISDAIHTNVWYALRRQHISMPYPTRTVHVERARASHGPGAPEHRRDPHEIVCELLRQQGIFKSMSHEHLKAMVSRCPMQHYGAGETIIRQGAEGASMFVLVGGEAGVTVNTGPEPTRVATLRGGDCFGEMSLLTGEKRSASVSALGDCEVMEITKPVFADAIQRDPELLTRLSALLAHRRMQTEDIVQAHAQQPALLAAREQEYQEGFLHTL